MVQLTAVFLGAYFLWFFASYRLKTSPPDSLPRWPIWIFFWPAQKIFAIFFGVTQSVEFDEHLDPKRQTTFPFFFEYLVSLLLLFPTWLCFCNF